MISETVTATVVNYYQLTDYRTYKTYNYNFLIGIGLLILGSNYI